MTPADYGCKAILALVRSSRSAPTLEYTDFPIEECQQGEYRVDVLFDINHKDFESARNPAITRDIHMSLVQTSLVALFNPLIDSVQVI